MKKTIFTFLILYSAFCISSAQPGSLDSSFGANGKVTTDFGTSDSRGYSVAIQSDGKILVAGNSFNSTTNYDFALTRYKSDGTLDSTFDVDGMVTTDIGGSYDGGISIAIQSDGKIVLGGTGNNGIDDDIAVVRYKSNGSLDSTFSSDGKLTTAFGSFNDYCNSVTIQSDGKIVVAGTSYNGSNNDLVLARYNSDGSLDTTFDSDGKVTLTIGGFDDRGLSSAIQIDGKIVVAGLSGNGSNSDFALVRYNSDGSLDNTTFGLGGIVTTDFGSSDEYGNSVVLQSDGKIMVVGYSNINSDWDFVLSRYNSNGILDSTFDFDGKVITDFGSLGDVGYSVRQQADGKIVVAGFSNNGTDNDFALTRYNSNGSLDNTFGSGGKVTTDFGSSNDLGYSIAIQNDGNIVMAGYSNNGSGRNFAVVRYYS